MDLPHNNHSELLSIHSKTTDEGECTIGHTAIIASCDTSFDFGAVVFVVVSESINDNSAIR